MVLFTLGISLISALLCSAPSLAQALGGAGASSASEALKEGAWSGTASKAKARMRSALAIVEVTLALILLIGAGTMVRTFKSMLARNPGYNVANLLTMQIALPESRYSSASQTAEFYSHVLENLRRLANAEAATVDATFGYAQGLYIEGFPDLDPDKPAAEIHSVSGDYFRTLRLPMIRGRAISDRDDREMQGVAIPNDVNVTITRNYGETARASRTSCWSICCLPPCP